MTESTQPLISVIMPVFNTAGYVGEAVQSVLNQEYQHWELIIINDGSMDDSEEVIRGFSDPRIIYLRQENQGVSNARNAGLRIMQGDFFCFLDSDDLLTPCSLKARSALLISDPHADLADGNLLITSESHPEIRTTFTPATPANLTRELVTLSGECFYGLTWMFRRKLGVAYEFEEDLSHGEDLLFCIIHSRNAQIRITSETTFIYRRRANSAMSNLKGLEEGYATIFRKLLEMDWLNPEWLNEYLFRVRRIMYRSYLKKLLFANALKSYQRFSLLKQHLV